MTKGVGYTISDPQNVKVIWTGNWFWDDKDITIMKELGWSQAQIDRHFILSNEQKKREPLPKLSRGVDVSKKMVYERYGAPDGFPRLLNGPYMIQMGKGGLETETGHALTAMSAERLTALFNAGKLGSKSVYDGRPTDLEITDFIVSEMRDGKVPSWISSPSKIDDSDSGGDGSGGGVGDGQSTITIPPVYNLNYDFTTSRLSWLWDQPVNVTKSPEFVIHVDGSAFAIVRKPPSSGRYSLAFTTPTTKLTLISVVARVRNVGVSPAKELTIGGLVKPPVPVEPPIVLPPPPVEPPVAPTPGSPAPPTTPTTPGPSGPSAPPSTPPTAPPLAPPSSSVLSTIDQRLEELRAILRGLYAILPSSTRAMLMDALADPHWSYTKQLLAPMLAMWRVIKERVER